MNKIKLIYAIFIGLFIFSSCSNNDDSETVPDPAPEPIPVIITSEIIGVWKPIKSAVVCSTGSEDIYDLDPCEKRGKIIFYNDSTMSISVTEANTDICRTIYQATGTWVLGNDELKLTIEGETEIPAFFELTNNILRIGGNEFEDNDRCDGDNLPSYYYTEYERAD